MRIILTDVPFPASMLWTHTVRSTVSTQPASHSRNSKYMYPHDEKLLVMNGSSDAEIVYPFVRVSVDACIYTVQYSICNRSIFFV